MVEIDEVGQVMDLDPLDGLVLCHRFLNLLNLGRFGFDFVVTVQTDIRGRNSCVTAFLCPKVAIHAGDLVFPGMDLVGKIDRLIGFITLMDSDLTSLMEGDGHQDQ